MSDNCLDAGDVSITVVDSSPDQISTITELCNETEAAVYSLTQLDTIEEIEFVHIPPPAPPVPQPVDETLENCVEQPELF